jgi:hypothetical protein
MDRRTALPVAVLGGVTVGAANWLALVRSVPLTATLVTLYALGLGLLLSRDDAYRRRDTDGPDWWAGTAGPLVIVVGVFGLNVGLGLPSDLRLSLLLLVVGAMLAAFGVGVASALSWAGVDASRADATDEGSDGSSTG